MEESARCQNKRSNQEDHPIIQFHDDGEVTPATEIRLKVKSEKEIQGPASAASHSNTSDGCTETRHVVYHA